MAQQTQTQTQTDTDTVTVERNVHELTLIRQALYHRAMGLKELADEYEENGDDAQVDYLREQIAEIERLEEVTNRECSYLVREISGEAYNYAPDSVREVSIR